MIQLGSIFAIVWLYRVKILHVLAGLPSDPDARRFAAMILVAVVPALVAGALLSNFVKSVLYESPAVFAVSFIVGGIVMLIVERFRPIADDSQRRAHPGRTRARRRTLSDARDRSGRVAQRCHDRRRHVDGTGPSGGRGVLLLSRDSDDGRRIRTRPARGAQLAGARARAGDRDRVRHGVCRIARLSCGRSSHSSAAPALRRSPGTESWPERPSSPRWRRAGDKTWRAIQSGSG